MNKQDMMKAAASYTEALKNPNRAVNVVDDVQLPELFTPVVADAEKAARAAHEEWLKDAAQRGVTRESNPNFVSYDELSEETKNANVAVALRTYKIFVYLGVKFVKNKTEPNVAKLEAVIFSATEIIHDGWSKDKLAAGWSFAPERDNESKKHTDLLDLETLVSIWPGKDEWDRNAVRGALDSLANDYGIYPVIE